MGYLGQVVIPGHFLLPSEENVEDMDFPFLFFAQIGLVKKIFLLRIYFLEQFKVHRKIEGKV